MQRFPGFAPVAHGHSMPVAAPNQFKAPPKQAHAQVQPVPFPQGQGWQAQPQPTAGTKLAGAKPAAPFPAPVPVQPVFRAKTYPDSEATMPAPKSLTTVALPPPEALGITPSAFPAPATAPVAAPAPVDWNVTRTRLKHMGASFSLVQLPGGTYRMVIDMPTANPNQNHKIEVVSESEDLAVTTALERAESWRK
jgi:hypothetical protein